MAEAQAKAAAEWLAGFHAHFWEKPTPEGVWDQGGYWYLDTRPHEFASIGGEVSVRTLLHVTFFTYPRFCHPYHVPQLLDT